MRGSDFGGLIRQALKALALPDDWSPGFLAQTHQGFALVPSEYTRGVRIFAQSHGNGRWREHYRQNDR
jgi:hypothetical protein